MYFCLLGCVSGLILFCFVDLFARLKKEKTFKTYAPLWEHVFKGKVRMDRTSFHEHSANIDPYRI